MISPRPLHLTLFLFLCSILLVAGCMETETGSNTPPATTIHAPQSGVLFTQGNEITLRGSGTDTEDGQITGTALVWSSDKDGQLGTGDLLTLTSLSRNTHTITLTATDSAGKSSSATIVITILAAPGNPQTTTQAFAGMDIPVDTTEFHGKVDLPAGFSPLIQSLQVETAFGGLSSLAADGTFTARMNTQAVGLLTLIDASQTPIMLAVFPKHELLASRPLLISPQTTAVALVFMQPGLAVENPIIAVVLLRIIETLPETASLTRLLERKMAIDPTILAKGDPEILAAVAKVIEALFNKAEAVSRGSTTALRSLRSLATQRRDTMSEHFQDIDGEEGDRVDVTATITRVDGRKLHGEFALTNNRSR